MLMSTHKTTIAHTERHRGASMPEILITILMISFGLLALAGMQSYAVAVNTLAGNRAIAAILANDFLGILQANRDGFLAGEYLSLTSVAFANTKTSTPFTQPQCVTDANCTATNLAIFDKQVFGARLKAALPAGEYRLESTGTNSANLWILWTEQVLKANTSTAEATADRVNDNCPGSMQNSNIAGLRCFNIRVSL